MKKKLLAIAGFIIAGCSLNTAKAQVSVDLNIHAGAPVYAAPQRVEYYYLPEAQAYYYVPARRYYYADRGRWVHASYLPGRYRGYNYSNTRRVAVYGSRPYLNHGYYRSHYASARPTYYRQANYYAPRNYSHGNGHAYGHYKNGHGRQEYGGGRSGHGHGHH